MRRTSPIPRAWLAPLLLAAAALLPLSGLSCGERPRATRAECLAILDRVVEIELTEMGFRDPALAVRRKQQVQQRLQEEIGQCIGRPLVSTAMRCVRRATSVEQLSHTCLR